MKRLFGSGENSISRDSEDVLEEFLRGEEVACDMSSVNVLVFIDRLFMFG